MSEDLKIDIEIENLLPKLDEEKYKLLEEEIKKNGCINPIIVWNGIIVDGHHRYKICQANNISFKTKEMQFDNKQEAMIWAWTTQKARRNVDDGTLFKIAEKFRPYYEEKAKENLIKSAEKTNAGFIKCENPSSYKEDEKIEPINTTKELASIAGTSQSTMNKVIQVQKHAPEPIQKAVENNVISINKGYEMTRKLKEIPKDDRQDEAKKMLEEQLNQENKQLDKEHRIYCKITDAVYKPISVEITEENVGYWIKDMSQDELEDEEKNIDQAIVNLQEIKRIIKKYKGIRRVK